ncbi:MAG: putative maltokinase, partial [Gemmatimonadetes bacterium]|nr:putative maltokinase [Gemmatimonadota bacterium]
PIVDILEQTPDIPPGNQWAIFLRNHDELTLEMVTDEERDYMYRVYAHEQTARINLGIRRRLAPLLENNRRKIELMNSLLFALPGTPVLYYGDEIGMGDNFYLGDRHGVRTPMQWSGDRNAGFSRANPQKLFLPVIIDPEYHYESMNVEAQHINPSSLLWWMRRIIALRKQHPAFGRGTFRWVGHDNRRVLAFLREHGEGDERERILVVVNLSRFSQAVELHLEEFEGAVPVELFGRTTFPAVGEEPYRLTLGPHNFFWFRLQPRSALDQEGEGGGVSIPDALDQLPRLHAGETWDEIFDEDRQATLEDALRAYVPARRWFGGKGRPVRSMGVDDLIHVELGEQEAAYLAVVHVEYVTEDDERYVLPLAFGTRQDGEAILKRTPSALVARLTLADGTEGVLFDAVANPSFVRCLLEIMTGSASAAGREGRLGGVRDEGLDLPADLSEVEVRVGTAEQSNTSIVLGERWILKLLRRLESGANLDREIGRALTVRGFGHTPAMLGAVEYRRGKGDVGTVAVLQAFVPNQGDAWEYTLDVLQRYLERAMASELSVDDLPLPDAGLIAAAGGPLPDVVHDVIEESTLENARLLGRRTGEMHRALAGVEEVDFRPEAFTTLYQRSLYQSMRNLLGQTFRSLERGGEDLDDDVRARAEEIVDRKGDLLGRFRSVLERKLEGDRIRIHGDYHLGQVLWTGKDFVIIDFEGEPARPLSERRLKRSPLRDVAGMLRSYHYAAIAALFGEREQGLAAAAELEDLEAWARFWHRWVSVAFLSGYLEGVDEDGFLPEGTAARQLLLDVYLLEKALYELGYELSNRPRWARIPIEGILELMGAAGEGSRES